MPASINNFYNSLREASWSSCEKAIFWLKDGRKVTLKKRKVWRGDEQVIEGLAYHANWDAIGNADDDPNIELVPVENIVSCKCYNADEEAE